MYNPPYPPAPPPYPPAPSLYPSGPGYPPMPMPQPPPQAPSSGGNQPIIINVTSQPDPNKVHPTQVCRFVVSLLLLNFVMVNMVKVFRDKIVLKINV